MKIQLHLQKTRSSSAVLLQNSILPPKTRPLSPLPPCDSCCLKLGVKTLPRVQQHIQRVLPILPAAHALHVPNPGSNLLISFHATSKGNLQSRSSFIKQLTDQASLLHRVSSGICGILGLGTSSHELRGKRGSVHRAIFSEDQANLKPDCINTACNVFLFSQSFLLRIFTAQVLHFFLNS